MESERKRWISGETVMKIRRKDMRDNLGFVSFWSD